MTIERLYQNKINDKTDCTHDMWQLVISADKSKGMIYREPVKELDGEETYYKVILCVQVKNEVKTMVRYAPEQAIREQAKHL